jgi:hypothetical protein
MGLIIDLGHEIDRVSGSRSPLKCSDLAEPYHALLRTVSHRQFDHGTAFHHTSMWPPEMQVQGFDAKAPPEDCRLMTVELGTRGANLVECEKHFLLRT